MAHYFPPSQQIDLQFFQHFYFRLHAGRSIRIVSEAINEFLDVLPMRQLGIVFATLCLQLFRSRFVELFIVAAIHFDALRM